MRFYQVHLTYESGTSGGSSWFSSKRLADNYAKQWIAGDPNDLRGATVNQYDIVPTKSGILEALNAHANHPDNG